MWVSRLRLYREERLRKEPFCARINCTLHLQIAEDLLVDLYIELNDQGQGGQSSRRDDNDSQEARKVGKYR